MKTFILLVALLVIPACLFAQAPRINKDYVLANEIMIEANGIHAVSRNATDTITSDIKNNTVFYCYADNTESFWYKIYANDNCDIAFDIFPEKKGNTFNYFLYKIPADISISDIEMKDIAPVRANLYKEDMFTTGTGLSLTSEVSYNNPGSKNAVKDFYYTPYHSAMPAKTGEVFMLNIYHVDGDDGGYRFILKNKKYSQKVQAVFQRFYAKRLAKTKVERSVIVNPKTKPNEPAKPAIAKADVLPNGSLSSANSLADQAKAAVFVVKDSLKHIAVVADVTCVKKLKGPASNSHSDEKGKYQTPLEKYTQYTITFSAVGYKNKIISFSTKDDPASFTQDIMLAPVGEGDNFVMDKIYFYPNTYAMKPGALSEVDKLLTYLNANPAIKVEVQGHTSGNKRIKAKRSEKEEEGSFAGSAKKLSQLRAEKIKKYLMEKGISGERLIANGYGGSEMIYPNPKNQSEANKNIRVAILILPQKETILSRK